MRWCRGQPATGDHHHPVPFWTRDGIIWYGYVECLHTSSTQHSINQQHRDRTITTPEPRPTKHCPGMAGMVPDGCHRMDPSFALRDMTHSLAAAAGYYGIRELLASRGGREFSRLAKTALFACSCLSAAEKRQQSHGHDPLCRNGPCSLSWALPLPRSFAAMGPPNRTIISHSQCFPLWPSIQNTPP